MEKIIKWSCLAASGCMIVLFVLAIYLASLLPDTFFVRPGEEIRVAGIPFLKGVPSGPRDAVAHTMSGGSYNADLSIAGMIPVKTVRARIMQPRVVQVCGTPFGMKMFANGAMIVGFSDIYTKNGSQNPAKRAGLQMGDVIVSVAGRQTKTNEDVAHAIQSLNGAPAEIVYRRDGAQKSVMLSAVYDDAAQLWRTGMWVRDSSAGIGTLTFADGAHKTFAGLGHSIHDVDTGQTISLLKGEIVPVAITGSRRGEVGSPGELQGEFLTAVPTGDITLNNETGVYGTLSAMPLGEAAEVALSQEIETGSAEMITTIEGQTPQRYSVVIEKIALNSEHPNRNMIVRVTDRRLLDTTGGIVQGMSGSPLLQNGRLIGAVTHVLVNDPTRGYAIFAENMLQSADRAAHMKKQPA